MIDDVAAQHADLAHRIENGDIGRGLGVVERVVVLGIEEARILDGDDRGLALPLDLGRTEIDHVVLDELAAHARSTSMLRQQHGVAQMHAGVGVGQHMRQENALIDFDAVLLALHQLRFRHRPACASASGPGTSFDGVVSEIVDAQEVVEIFGELAIDRIGMIGQKSFARIAAVQLNDIGRQLLLARPLWLLRQLGQEIRASAPVFRRGGGIALEIAAKAQRRFHPGVRRL